LYVPWSEQQAQPRVSADAQKSKAVVRMIAWQKGLEQFIPASYHFERYGAIQLVGEQHFILHLVGKVKGAKFDKVFKRVREFFVD
jgi:hypothetical protein